jgi:hypothetical protein
MSLRRLCEIALLMLLVLAGCSRGPQPLTAAEQAEVNALLAALNAGDRPTLVAYAQEHTDPEYHDTKAIERGLALHAQFGGFDLLEAQEISPRQVHGWMRAKHSDAVLELALDFDESPPHRLTYLRIDRGTVPEKYRVALQTALTTWRPARNHGIGTELEGERPRQNDQYRSEAMRTLGLSIGIWALVSAVSHSQNAERHGIGLVPATQVRAMSAQPAAAAPVTIDPRRSLFITDSKILASFTFAEVMTAIANGAPSGKLTKEQLYEAWWDTANKSPTGQTIPFRCEQANAALNGFSYECPRHESSQAAQNPFGGAADDQYIPIALSNRFDLATTPAQGGGDCGEYRIVFARRSGQTRPLSRNLIIFEAVLPNMKPSTRNLEGCRPVAQFWADLSRNGDKTDRARKLHDFYFRGLPGLSPPVVDAKHYGTATSGALGQVRTNQFMQPTNGVTFNWVLRQFHVVTDGQGLRFNPVAVGNNPAGVLFDEHVPQPAGPAFRAAFVDVVKTLSSSDINLFNMGGLERRFDAAESDEMDPRENNYEAQSSTSMNFLSSIAGGIPPGPLTSTHIARRATALSCAGCHQLSNAGPAADLGGGMTWKPSLGFVHASEETSRMQTCSDDPAAGPRNCFAISRALEEVFLPNRADILSAFLGGGAP